MESAPLHRLFGQGGTGNQRQLENAEGIEFESWSFFPQKAIEDRTTAIYEWQMIEDRTTAIYEWQMIEEFKGEEGKCRWKWPRAISHTQQTMQCRQSCIWGKEWRGIAKERTLNKGRQQKKWQRKARRMWRFISSPKMMSHVEQCWPALCFEYSFNDSEAISVQWYASGGLEEGASRLRPPPLGDGLTPSLTILLISDNYLTVSWRRQRQLISSNT